jgi:hypothetical protein
VVTNGETTRFWLDKWTVDGPLKLQFPRLFSLANDQNVMISDLGTWTEVDWIWDFRWRHNLFVREENQLASLITNLRPVTNTELSDSWRWNPHPDGFFTFSSVYSLLDKRFSV